MIFESRLRHCRRYSWIENPSYKLKNCRQEVGALVGGLRTTDRERFGRSLVTALRLPTCLSLALDGLELVGSGCERRAEGKRKGV